MDVSSASILVTVLMPCLNEAETLAACIRTAHKAIQSAEVAGEVLIADNGSTDGSQAIAIREGARVVHVSTRGYGAALIAGIEAASGEYILMGDADRSYDFSHLDRFLNALRSGADLVMGNRFKGGIEPRAMPFLHRYLGNPVLSWLGRLLFKAPVGDFHCGLRAFRRSAIQSLHLHTTGMEFASEMIVKACLQNLTLAEVPTTLSPDGRSRPPHLRTWRDGWRHLRFLLLYSPRWLFLYPGVIALCVGMLLSFLLLRGPLSIYRFHFDVGALAYALALTIIGFQTCVFAVSAKIFGMSVGLLPPDAGFHKWFRYVNLERGVTAGLVFICLGLAYGVYDVWDWAEAGFGVLDTSKSIRMSLPVLGAMVLGVEMVLSSFFLSLLGLRRYESVVSEEEADVFGDGTDT
jgi:glycosyltransferase involved in cell wall biosynthesis